ncbi:hypothetical protein F2Q68_00021565 [Brassica cretica]|uniref:ACT domain-containing protein n=1 Tax=Brassica cretica TaxID=69181 RepID=A0A8S9FV81_BRACR|nr:hypothetical protein F2Q68_00021565 [Brassica cretica]
MVQTAQRKRELSTRAPPPPSGRLGSAWAWGLGLGAWGLGVELICVEQKGEKIEEGQRVCLYTHRGKSPDHERIWLPPLETLPLCQAQVVTKVTYSWVHPLEEERAFHTRAAAAVRPARLGVGLGLGAWGDQASIIGGVVEYISELQQVLQSLEAKKERKTYAEVLSPRLVPSPRPSPPVLSPRKPPISPRISHQHLLLHPISPRTPLPTSPYGGHPPQLPLIPQPPRSYSLGDPPPYSPASSSSSPSVSSNHESSLINELVANSKSALADVEVKFSGANVLLKTVSHKIPGQVMKIIAALEDLSLEILQVNINTVEETMLYSFTIKGDQASIIGGVVEYISELQQVLQSLEAKKERKTYAEVLSPRLVPSPRPSPPVLSPRKPPISPRISHQHLLLHPISPRTPLPTSPYGGHPPQLPLIPQPPRSYSLGDPPPYSPASSSSSPSVSSNHESSLINELVANSKSALADVEVKFSGANVLLKTVSHKIPGQVMKIIAALEDLSLEILQVNINTVEETMLYSFTIKVRTNNHPN